MAVYNIAVHVHATLRSTSARLSHLLLHAKHQYQATKEAPKHVENAEDVEKRKQDEKNDGVKRDAEGAGWWEEPQSNLEGKLTNSVERHL